MEKFFKIGKVISDICLGIFIFLIIPGMLFLLVFSRTKIFGIHSFVVQTGSMKPVIPVGAIVFSQAEANYKKGQIITFDRRKITVTHRINDIKDGQFQTKGDANNAADPQLIDKSAIIGKVFFIIPYLGLITMFVKTIPGFLLVVVLPNLVFIGFEILNIKEEYRRHLEREIRKELKTVT